MKGASYDADSHDGEAECRSPSSLMPADSEAWIPDTLRFASLAREVGNDRLHFTPQPIFYVRGSCWSHSATYPRRQSDMLAGADTFQRLSYWPATNISDWSSGSKQSVIPNLVSEEIHGSTLEQQTRYRIAKQV